MQKKILFAITLSAGMLVTSTHQVVAQSSLSAASHETQIGNYQFAYSVGEMTLVHTTHTSRFIVTQGYYQPVQGKVQDAGQASQNLSTSATNIKVYPNPTDNLLFIQDPDHSIRQWTLLDAAGKTLLQSGEMNKDQYPLDLSTLAAGNYFLMLHSTEVLSFKIQKLN